MTRSNRWQPCYFSSLTIPFPIIPPLQVQSQRTEPPLQVHSQRTEPKSGEKRPITATMGMCYLVKTWWRWGWDVALSVPLLLMLPSAISFSNLLRMFFITRPEPVRGKVVLITGASSGIGQHMAWEYAKRGANLVVVARRRNRLEEVAKECKAYGAQYAVVCPADLSKPQDCKRIVEFTISTFGRLDVLVNNAGTAGGSLFEEYENAAEYKRIVDIDFWGPVNTTHFALEHLQRRRGQIVVTSSMTAFLPFPFTTVYSAAKGALFNFFETLRIELISKSVTVTIASPGFIQSELTSREWPGKLPWWFPMARTEDAAREIVEAALRKERDVITPRWYSSLLWFRILCPEILEWVPRVFILGQAPTRGVEIVCNSVFGKFNTHTLFKTLKLA